MGVGCELPPVSVHAGLREPSTRRIEAQLADTNHVLVALGEERPDFDFFGSVVTLEELAGGGPSFAGKTVYLTGDISKLHQLELKDAARVFVIEELSRNFGKDVELVGLGRVPIPAGGAGVYYRQFFDDADDHFRNICAEHSFQALKESVKPSTAHRTGLYLSPVTQHGDELHFNLLRCFTNLSGPTENFCATDRRIVDALNHEAASIFLDHARLNHVLAQVYANTRASSGEKQTKAKISAHADKTKDMPVDGIMAFCTFYDQLGKLGQLTADGFDYGYKGKTALTRLRFRLKQGLVVAAGQPAEFSLTLYPNSVFFMPLSTNRLYTHEIQSSMLDAEMLPTRLGYVVRCSKTEAVHKDGTTFLKVDGQLVRMEPPTQEGMRELRALYAAENGTHDFIEYGDRILFSMNSGDYLAPDDKRG
ncbi:MAG: hypothetical protein ABI704_11920 [Kofleriaceae bacterium]